MTRHREPGIDRHLHAVDRRAFVRAAAAASAVVAGTVLAPAPLVASANREGSAAEPVWRRTMCRLCGVGCGLLVGVERGRAVAVKGDPESAVSAGLACARGYHAAHTLYGGDRLTRALVRRDGRLVATPVNDALDLVAAKMREAVASHGPDAIAFLASTRWSITDGYVAARFMKGALGTNNVDTDARLETASAAMGATLTYGDAGPAASFEDVAVADVFVLWDANLAETDPVLFSRILARRQANPSVRIVDLATRTTRTSYAADTALLYVPRSELAVANALCQEIVARKWAHREFIDRHVAFMRGPAGAGPARPADGPDPAGGTPVTWQDYVAFLGLYTPEAAQRTTGLSAENLRWLASLYGDRTRRVMTLWGTSLNAHARGTWVNNAIHNIHLLVGKVGTAGNVAACVSGPSSAASPMHGGAAPDALPGGRVNVESDRTRVGAAWGLGRDRLTSRPGRTLVEALRGLADGKPGVLWIQGANPVAAVADLRRVLGAANRFLVVSDAYPTATTDLADVVLPSAIWIERDAVYANAERRLQAVVRSVDPPGDALPDAWQVIQVARRLGHGAHFPWDAARHVELAWDEYRRVRGDSVPALPPWNALLGRHGVRWPPSDGGVPSRDARTDAAPADGAPRDRIFPGAPDARARIWLRPHEAPAEGPDRDHPFWFTTGGVLEHTPEGTLTRRVPALHRAMPAAYVEVNRDDAIRSGIADGDRVRLVSRRGAVTVEARVDRRGQPPRGVLFAPTFDEAARLTLLLPDALCPISRQPEGACAVRLERVGSEGSR